MHDADARDAKNHNDFHRSHNVNERTNDDDCNSNDYDANRSDKAFVAAVLGKDSEGNDEY